MGFIWRAKQGLRKSRIKRPKVVSFEKEKKNVKEKEKKKRRRGRRRIQAKIKLRYGTWIFGMETHLDYESYKIWYGCLDFGMELLGLLML